MSVLTDPDHFVQTGFLTSISYKDEDEIKLDKLEENEHRNLMM